MLAPAQAAFAGSAVPQVLVSAAPLQPIADAILLGIAQSSVLARPGQDPHTMTLSFSQARAIDAADIILVPDRRMNPIIAKLAAKREHPPLIIALTELKGAQPLAYPPTQPWLHDEGAEEDDEDAPEHPDEFKDPHLWLDPLRMAAIALPLADAMGDVAPSHRAEMEANAVTLQHHLTQEVDPALRAMFAQHPANPRYATRPYIPFVTGHSAYQYFLKRYGIDDPGALLTRPEDYLGAATSHDVFSRASKVSIGCLITEQDTPMVRRVAEASGAKTILLSPENFVARDSVPVLSWMQNDYDRLLYATARTFADCLAK